ncbi:MAG: nodulation protein NfeD [Bacteroidetes bacterium]|jgi:membrane-bound serine protease (ClpP class)|nr:nodulation protein NfeD [Bacteroidota bacterium]MBS1981100.1 nodulation protein NfeD [Bacteroidota bacterium]
MKRKLLFFVCVLFSMVAVAQSKEKVMVMDIKAEIDPRMLRYVKLSLEHAEKIKADYVIIDMDTYGGVLTDAKEIVDLIMDFKKPIWVFINSDAASAGALISIACDSIYMSPGASIGAATVVEGDGKAAPDKYQSYMRSIMRSTAEENHRDPRIAEGMVDERIAIDSIKQAGKVITFTTNEAIKYRYCEAKVNSIEEILSRNKIEHYEIDHFQLGATEKIIAFFLNPFISGLLILCILGGIYFEFQAPGTLFPIAAALVALLLYLIPYYLNGLAQYWEIIALFIGILLLLAEIFIIPGFGVAGIAGITLTVVSLILIMLNNDFFNFEFVPLGDIVKATFAAVGGITGGALLLFFGGAKLTQTKAFKKIALTDTQESASGYSVNAESKDMIGKTGITHTVLRPSGKVLIEGEVYDAFTRGEYIQKGEPIEVVSTEGVTLRVKGI